MLGSLFEYLLLKANESILSKEDLSCHPISQGSVERYSCGIFRVCVQSKCRNLSLHAKRFSGYHKPLRKVLIALICDAPSLAVTLISLGEYELGLLQSRQRVALAGWLGAFLAQAELLMPGRETLPFCEEVRAQLKGDRAPVPTNDRWIAALARQHKMLLVSRDQHFDFLTGMRRVVW
jgi:predicted nucleic acid-binding protein